jgi:hypothetical protein
VAKDFDTTLSDAIDLAAEVAKTAGASAARIRGRKRTMRKRVVLSTMSFVLVAAGSTAAFALSSSHGGTTSQLPDGRPSTGGVQTPSSVPTSTGTLATTTPDMSPSQPTTTSATNSSTATAASKVWLTPAQLPFHSAMNWAAGSPTHCTGSMVFNANFPGDCGLHNQPGTAHAAQKLDIVKFDATGVPTGNGAWAQPVADQDFFTYATSADAQAAFQSVTHGILAEDGQFNVALDPNTHRPIVSTTIVTTQSAGGMAIDHKLRDDKGAPGLVNGEYSGASDVHFYFALKGNVLEVLEVRGGVSISGTTDDKAILQTVVNALG